MVMIKETMRNIFKNGFVLAFCITCGAIGFAVSPSGAATDAPTRTLAAKVSKTVSLRIGTKGDEMAFNKATLSAPAGASVRLTFKNGSKTLQHNFVLVKPGSVASAGLSAGVEKSYVAESPNVLAHTKLLSTGQSETLTFTAPSESGSYPYICTFPGHATTMKGVFKVK
jgi:azurin